VNKTIKLSLIILLITFTFNLSANSWRLGADHAEPGVAMFLTGLELIPGTMYVCTETDTANLIALAEMEKINVFELIDCIYRYINPRNIRFTIFGKHIREMQSNFDLGGDRILAILAIDTLRYIEFGSILEDGQKAMDAYLESAKETYIEIGMAYYESEFGFLSLSPLLFNEAYGIIIKKAFFKAPLIKVELFSPGKGAIYVKNMFRPKRWNLDVVTKKTIP